jgi:hypothetical protein
MSAAIAETSRNSPAKALERENAPFVPAGPVAA